MYPLLASTRSGSNELAAKLLVGAEGVWFIVNGQKHAILPETIKRSTILRDICYSKSNQQEAELPLSQNAMENWLHYAQNATASQKTAVQPEKMQHYCLLLLAADILVDETTKRDAASCIRHCLFPVDTRTARTNSTSAAKVFQTLTQDLALSVLRSPPRASLSQLLLSLPESVHQLIIRAHDPSVDGRKSLHLDGLSGDSLPLALSGASAHTQLTLLSLRDQQIPLPSVTLADLLDCLPDLLCLDLSNSLLPVTVQHLGPVLAHCPRLSALDLSCNNLSAGGISALCPALRGLPMLRVLILRDTTCDPQEVSALAEHASSLLGLHALSISAPSWRVQHECALERGSLALARAVETLLVQLRLVATLRQLEVVFVGMVSSPALDCAIVAAVGGLSQLHSLKLPLPPTSIMPLDSLSHPQWPLTQLTALDLAEGPDVREIGNSSMRTSMLPDFQQMAALESLRLPILLDDHEGSETAAVEEIVKTLAALTALSFHIPDIHQPEWLSFLQQLPQMCALQEVEVDLVTPCLNDEIASSLESLAPCVSILAILDDVPTMSSLVMLLPHIKWLVLHSVPMDGSFAPFVSGMSALSRLQQLEIGHVSGHRADDGVCRRFCECLPLLYSLDDFVLSGDIPKALVLGAAQKISVLSSLRSVRFVLSVRPSLHQPELVPVLQGECEEHGHLRRLHLVTHAPSLPDCSKLTTLQELHLDILSWRQQQHAFASDEGNDGGTAGDGCAWVDGLQQLPRLRRLAISYSGFGEASAAALASALTSGGLAALEVLDMTGCWLGDQAVALEAAVPAWVKYKPHSTGFMAM